MSDRKLAEGRQGEAEHRARALRPFQFMVPFWGERYRNYFVDLCLPSLLAPANLPVLSAKDGHRFLLATRREDWNAIEELPIMARLRAHAEPVLIEVAGPDKETAACSTDAVQYQQICQKKLLSAGYESGGFGCLLSPDVIVSDGMVSALFKHALAGKVLVLCASLRHVEDKVLAHLQSLNLLPEGVALSAQGQALTIPQRLMAELAVSWLHDELEICNADGGMIVNAPPFLFWRVAQGTGLIIRTFFGVPVLIDFSALSQDHIACLEEDMLEQVYVGRNFSSEKDIYIVRDSDEFGMVSVSPATAGQRWTKKRNGSVLSRITDSVSIRQAMALYGGRRNDVIKREMFRHCVRWHAGPIDEAWLTKERQIDEWIHSSVGDYFDAAPDGFGDRRFPRPFSLDPRFLPLDAFYGAKSIAKRIKDALIGRS